jgi:hypothetical protein
VWTPASAAARLAYVDEAMRLAAELGAERSHLVSATLRTVVLSELGRPQEMWPAGELARAEARALRIAFAEVVLAGLQLPWLAMAGRFDECDRVIGEIGDLSRRMSHFNVDEALASGLLAVRLWQGRGLEMVDLLERLAPNRSFAAAVAVYLWRSGERDRARAYYAEHGAHIDGDNDVSLLTQCFAAELSLHLGDRALAAEAYALVAPYAGQCCSAGSGLAVGPVDAFLAMAAAATGELGLAGRHADDALALAAAWEVPLVAGWIAEQRRAYGY